MKKTKKTILVVDDEPIFLAVLEEILQDEYRLIFTKAGKSVVKSALKERPNLILLDVCLQDISGYDVCTQLKSNKKTQHIPVIFITGMTESESEYKGFEVGAVDYITKPVIPHILLSRVKIHTTHTLIKNFEKAQLNSLKMLAKTAELNDVENSMHIWRMADYCYLMAIELGWDMEHAEFLRAAASTHDLGKIAIPSEILHKPGKLTSEEWDIMKTHSTIGYKILSICHTDLFKTAAAIALSHHERWDGTGYPRGLKGDEIPIAARIAAIADVFDALNMHRPYKTKWPIEDIVDKIKNGAGSQFDPSLVEVFLRTLSKFLEVGEHWEEKTIKQIL